MAENNKRRPKATPVQLSHLVTKMQFDSDLANGVAKGLQGRLLLEEKWEGLTLELNALGGPTKTKEKWKQTWRDLRNKTKNKIANNKSEYKGDRPGGTGNGSPRLHTITALDEAVMTVMGEVTILGMPDVPVTVPEPCDHSYAVFVPPPSSPAPASPAPAAGSHLPPSTPPPPEQTLRSSGGSRPRRRVRRVGMRVENFDFAILDIEEKKLKIKERKVEALER